MRTDTVLPTLTELLTWGAAAGTAVLALTSTGSVVVAAVLFGVANRSRWSGLAALLATAAVAVRFASVGFDDLAGAQSVLGAAGAVGPSLAAASSWLAAVAVLLAVRGAVPGATESPGSAVARTWLIAIAGGALAATIVAGPGADDLWLRIASTVIASGVAVGVVAGDRQRRVRRVRPALAVVAGVVAVALASWPT